MNFRKFKADHLFTGHQWLGDQHVLVTRPDGEVADILPLADAGEGIEEYPGILSPGLINCHCHLELSHLKGVIPEKTGMIDFLLGVISQRHFPPEQIEQAIADADEAMIRNGIVAVGDISNTNHTIRQKVKSPLHYHNFIEATGFIEATAERRFADYLATYREFESVMKSVSIAPHAPYSVSPRLFNLIARFPGNQVISMHNQESVAENDFFTTGTGDFRRLYQALNLDISFFKPTGTTSLEYCIRHFLPEQTVILVHNAVTGVEDLALVQESTSTFFLCLCPNANRYIGNPLPDVELLRRSGVPIVVGTDSLASNHALSVVGELKTIHESFPAIDKFELLQWATINGAKALQVDDVYGSFAKGMKPGVVVIGNELDTITRLLPAERPGSS